MGATQGIYALSGQDENWKYRLEVLKLICPGDRIQTCEWREMPEKLDYLKAPHVSLLLPESYDICN